MSRDVMSAKELLTQANLHETNWGERIITAEERGEFTRYDRARAGNWFDCACGKQDSRIPRHGNWKPVDFHLGHCGEQFSFAVEGNDFTRAARLLIAIEKRAAEVLAEVTA